jgi:esterase/lipase superfamily enzyme
LHFQILPRPAVALVLGAILSGCVGDKAEFVHSVWRPPDGGAASATVYYLTDRAADRAWPGGFSKHWGDRPSCGTTLATIPAASLADQPIPTGSIRTGVTLDCGANLSGFASQIADAARRKNCNGVLLYVHGFNTLFDGAVLRAAQLANDTQSGCVAAVFDWSSEGEIGRYIPDIEHSAYATPLLAQFFEALAGTHLKVDVVAHSVGDRIVLAALSAYASRPEPPQAKFISELVLAAGDVGADPANNDFAHLVRDARPFVNRITIYASHGDAVLAVSAAAHGNVPRAGSLPRQDRRLEGAAPEANVDVIDASLAPAETLGHSYFAMSYEAVSDIALVLRGVPIERRLERNDVWPATLVCAPPRNMAACDAERPHYVLKVAARRRPDFFLRLVRRLVPLVPRIGIASFSTPSDQ